MRLLWSILVFFGLSFSTSFASEIYLDDRSTAESLVRSYYNAINRKEFGRAYEYFSDAPPKSFADFSNGFADTRFVEVLTGEVTSEGAAGSIFYDIPIAIRATRLAGAKSYFNGCFTLRQINAEQDPPTRAMQIKQAKLNPTKEEDYNMYSLPACASDQEAEVLPTTDASVLAQVTSQFISENAENCTKAAEAKGGLNLPQVDIFSELQPGNEQPTTYRLYRFQCNMGAYNSVEIYYLQSSSEPPQRLSFAAPDLDIAYIDQDGDHAQLKSLKVAGWTASHELVNSEFDPNTKSITDFSKWRGIGDALSVSTWFFSNGRFVLKDYSVDPTYDGEQNPVEVLKNGQVEVPYLLK